MIAPCFDLPYVNALAAGDDKDHHGDMQRMNGGPGAMVGQPGNAHEVTRTIAITIAITIDDNIRLSPDSIIAKPGETVRLFVKNTGSVTHEMVLESMDELRAHAEMMRSTQEMKHESPNMLGLNPGKRGAIVWRFDKAGTANSDCLIPGHLEGGMVGTIHIQ